MKVYCNVLYTVMYLYKIHNLANSGLMLTNINKLIVQGTQ